jgi:DNA-directed RNA polymerase specialized sigma24 family protein
LARELTESQAAGGMSPGLIEMVSLIARRYRRRYNNRCSSEDSTQDALLAVVKCLDRIDPARNPFAYITQVVANEMRCGYRQERAQDRIVRGLADRLGFNT